MNYDSATHSIHGRYCLACGRQAFDRTEATCKICGGELFKWQPSRQASARLHPPGRKNTGQVSALTNW